MRDRLRVVGVALSLALAIVGHAQSIRVSVIDAADVEHTVDWFDYGQDVRVDLADITEQHHPFKFIRVMDTASLLGDISRVSLYRSSTTTAISDEIRVFIGSRGSVGFPLDYNLRIPIEGCRHWGLPLTPGGADDAFVVENTVPEETKIILAAAISGDLIGKITTGQVFRLQVTDGVIADDVRATWPSGSPELDTDTSLSYAIEYIEAKSITGRIIAGDETGPPVNPLPVHCSIRDIRVGGGYEETTQGIRGDIDAFGGHVRNVESAGDIGTAQVPVKINTGPGVAGNTPRATPASAGTG